MTVRDAGHEQTEPHACRDRGERGKRRVALEALARSAAVHRLEVIEPPDAVEAEVLGEPRPGRDLRPRHPLLGDVETEPHRAISSHNSESMPQPSGGGASRQYCSGAGAASF